MKSTILIHSKGEIIGMDGIKETWRKSYKNKVFSEDVRTINCEIIDCRRVAIKRLFSNSKIIYTCLQCFDSVCKLFDVENKIERDLTITLQSGKKVLDQTLFITKSIVEVKSKISKDNFKGFGVEKIKANPRGQLFLDKLHTHIAWETGEKAELINKGARKIRINYKGRTFIYAINGIPLYEIGENGNPIRYFNW